DGHAIIKSILLCLWAFVGVESAAVSTGMVKNPKRTVPLATMLGTGLAGIVYIAATQVLSGMYPSSDNIKAEARTLADCEPMLASFYHATLLKHEN
ncbi:amino acid permease, partial [Escherichia coli]|uniref:amino acid permease n=1 Tax=Escherichia coli TaxID=562 RepID=UPI0035C85A23